MLGEGPGMATQPQTDFFFLTDLIRLERSLKRGLLSHHVTHSAECCGCGNLKPHFLAWVWLIHYLGNSGLSETK